MARLAVVLLTLAAALTAAPRTRLVGPGQKYAAPCAAIAAASDGDIIEIDAKGAYKGDVCSISKNRLTIRGVNGRPIIDAGGRAAAGKGIWVVAGSDNVVENLEFTGATVPDKNGAGIRMEGKNLTVRNCYFHHNENGILTSQDLGTLRVEHSEFGWNGFGTGYTHNIYVGHIARFELHASYMHASKGGNLVKSRAAVNVITYNRISSETGDGSYELDLPNGGQALVLGNVIQQGAQSVNEHMIEFGVEGPSPGSRLVFVSNTVVNTRTDGRYFLLAERGVVVDARNNVFAGKGELNLPGMTLPEGNIMDPNLTVVDAAAMNFAPAAGAPGINAARETALWENQSVVPQLQYVHPMCVQPRTAVGTMDAGAFEFGLPAGPLTCGSGPAPVARLGSLEMARPDAAKGAAVEGIVKLTAPASGLGLAVALDSDLPAFAEGGTLFIPGGESALRFTAKTPAVTTRTEKWLRAEFGGEQKTAKLTLLPDYAEPAKLLSITAVRQSVVRGEALALKLTLDRPAQAGGVRVDIAASNPSLAKLPKLVTIPESAMSAEFTVQALRTKRSMPLVVSASVGSEAALTLQLWVLPSGSATQTPRPV